MNRNEDHLKFFVAPMPTRDFFKSGSASKFDAVRMIDKFVTYLVSKGGKVHYKAEWTATYEFFRSKMEVAETASTFTIGGEVFYTSGVRDISLTSSATADSFDPSHKSS